MLQLASLQLVWLMVCLGPEPSLSQPDVLCKDEEDGRDRQSPPPLPPPPSCLIRKLGTNPERESGREKEKKNVERIKMQRRGKIHIAIITSVWYLSCERRLARSP